MSETPPCYLTLFFEHAGGITVAARTSVCEFVFNAWVEARKTGINQVIEFDGMTDDRDSKPTKHAVMSDEVCSVAIKYE